MRSIKNENNNPFMLKGVRNERGYWIVDNDRYNAEEVTLVMHEVYTGWNGEVHAVHVDVLPWATEFDDATEIYHKGSKKSQWYVCINGKSMRASGYQPLITTSKNQMFVK